MGTTQRPRFSGKKKSASFFKSNCLGSIIALILPLENHFLFEQVRLLPVLLPWVPHVMKYKAEGKILVPSSIKFHLKSFRAENKIPFQSLGGTHSEVSNTCGFYRLHNSWLLNTIKTRGEDLSELGDTGQRLIHRPQQTLGISVLPTALRSDSMNQH